MAQGFVTPATTCWMYVGGTVKLTEPRARGDEFWSRWASGDGACVGDVAPDSKAVVTRSAAEVGRGGFRIRDVEEVRDLIVNRQKPLCLPGRFESLHDQFASPRRLVRVFRAIVQALVLAMFDAKAHLHPRSAVRTELVRDHDARRCDGGFQELPYEPLRSATVSSTLDQDVENDAVLIDGGQSQCGSPAIEMTTSSICHLSPRAGARWRI